MIEGEAMGLADLGWGHGGVEEGFEDLFGEMRGSRRNAEVAEITRRCGGGRLGRGFGKDPLRQLVYRLG